MLGDLTLTIPTYNRNDYLVKILDSIPHDTSVVVGDNGGSVTKEIVGQYPGFTFVHPSKKLEMFENWNFCISNVKTTWFMIPSDDDLYYPHAFEKIGLALNNYPDADIIIFGHNVIDEYDEVLSTWKSSSVEILKQPQGYDYFKYGVEARLPSIIFKTEKAKLYGLFDESYVYTAADSLLIQKCMLYGKTIILPEVISGYRVWKDNFTNRFISTPDWLNKVDQWQNEISIHVNKVYRALDKHIDTQRIKDEVYASNLAVGLGNKRSKEGIKAAFLFFKSVRFPFKAKIVTQLRILKALLIK